MNEHNMEYYFKKMPSPVGTLRLVANDTSLLAVLWEWEEDDNKRTHMGVGIANEQHPILLETEKQLQEYFNKQRTVFTITLDFIGTDFQKKVWQALLTIPFGETRTYGAMAKQVGDPNASRAIGGAVNKNPISIIAPCHRVIGSTGKMVGFAGGLENKAYLLALENRKVLTLW